MFDKLRNKLLIWFLTFSTASILMILSTHVYINKQKQYTTFINAINECEKIFYKDVNAVQTFLYYETFDTTFYITNRSHYIEKHSTHYRRLTEELHGAIPIVSNHLYSTLLINDINNMLVQFDSLVRTIEKHMLLRGFKDYGLIGQMRRNAHFLENDRQFVDQNLLLSMRRREKDYLLRFDEQYIMQFKQKGSELFQHISKFPGTTIEKTPLLNALNQYMHYFDKIVFIDKTIGARSHQGLTGELLSNTNKIGVLFSAFVTEAETMLSKNLQKVRFQFIAFGLALIIISIIGSFVLSVRITAPIRNLSLYIADFVNSKFTLDKEYEIIDSKNEIGRLSRNFNILKDEVLDHIHRFRSKVKERTAEILEQKLEIENQKEEIIAQRDALESTNHLISAQKHLVENQNKNIISSIRYAMKIQKAMLSDLITIKNIWKETFVFIQPRDIVSGDFYFIEKVKIGSSEKIIFSAVDCTGHGVPGALMSILAFFNLKNITKEMKHANPCFTIPHLNRQIYESLHGNRRKNNHMNDGLDIAYALYDPETKILEYAGINQPAYIVRNKELIELEATKMQLGDTPDFPKQLKKGTMKMLSGDMVYLFSDGFYDQFGGATGKKFKKKYFRSLLIEISEESVDKQRTTLKDTFEDWRAGTDQVDDVLVMGFRIE
ncbi:MAG: SpoIIE family protein phosphatase [Salinivirgaceae bacterium]